MSDVVRASTARLSLVLVLMTAAAAITLVLGMIGLYGVMAYMVALRNREFGVRVALDADPKRIARLVATRGLALTASGVAAGFVAYALTAPFLRAFLFGVTVADPAAGGSNARAPGHRGLRQLASREAGRARRSLAGTSGGVGGAPSS